MTNDDDEVDTPVEAGPAPTPTGTPTPTPGPASCQLYPIALHADTIAGAAEVGQELADVYEGTGPGNFGWLSWSGARGVPVLVHSLTPPGDSDTYVDPYDPGDHTLSAGEWVYGRPGVANSRAVRHALDALEPHVITVPVWDTATGRGRNRKYHVTGFARVQITGYHLPRRDRISAIFWGNTTCPEHGP